jgi:hypothetical protein
MESDKEDSVEFSVIVAVVVVVQQGVEGSGEVIFGIGSMLKVLSTEETGPLTIPESEVFEHGSVNEDRRELAGGARAEEADGGTRGGLVDSILVDHVSLDNMGYGNGVTELDRYGHGGERRVGGSFEDCTVVAYGVVDRAGG